MQNPATLGRCRGKPSGRRPERNQGLRVVLDVTEGLHDRNVTCDNCFTSYELARQLLERKITVVGMFRKNRPELPTGLLAAKGREVFSSKFAFTPTATLVSYIHRRGRCQRPWGRETAHRPGHQPQQRWRGQPRQGDRNVQLQEDDRALAPGRLSQHSRCLFLQRLCDMERDPPRLDVRQAEQAECVPRAAGRSSCDSVHRTKEGHPPDGSVRRCCEGCKSRCHRGTPFKGRENSYWLSLMKVLNTNLELNLINNYNQNYHIDSLKDIEFLTV